MLEALGDEPSRVRLGGSMALAEHQLTVRQPRGIDLFMMAAEDAAARLADAARALQRSFYPPRYRLEPRGSSSPVHFALTFHDHRGQRLSVNLLVGAELSEPVSMGDLGTVMNRQECAQRTVGSMLGSTLWRARGYVDIAHMYLEHRDDDQILAALRGDHLGSSARSRYRDALRAVADMPQAHLKALTNRIEPPAIATAVGAVADQVALAHRASDGRGPLLHQERSTLTPTELHAAYGRLVRAGAYAWESVEGLAQARARAQGDIETLRSEIPKAKGEARDLERQAMTPIGDEDDRLRKVIKLYPEVSSALLRQKLHEGVADAAARARSLVGGLEQDLKTCHAQLKSITDEVNRRDGMSGRDKAAEAAVRTGRNEVADREGGTAWRHNVISLAERRLSGAPTAASPSPSLGVSQGSAIVTPSAPQRSGPALS